MQDPSAVDSGFASSYALVALWNVPAQLSTSVCVCLWEWKGSRDGERRREREREREGVDFVILCTAGVHLFSCCVQVCLCSLSSQHAHNSLLVVEVEEEEKRK